MNTRASLLLVAVILPLACQLTTLQPFAPASPDQAIPTSVPPTFTPRPPSVIPPTLTPQPVTGTVKENLRVRSAPNSKAEIVDHLSQGDTVQIIGRTAASDWFQVPLPKDPKARGWVSAQYVKAAASIDTIPVVQPGTP